MILKVSRYFSLLPKKSHGGMIHVGGALRASALNPSVLAGVKSTTQVVTSLKYRAFFWGPYYKAAPLI